MRARDVPRGRPGRMIAATIDMIATMQTTSTSVKPSSAPLASANPTRDICCRSRATFLSIRPVRNHVIRTVLSGRSIDVSIAPRIFGNHAPLQVWTVPRRDIPGRLHERVEALGRRRIAANIEEIEIQRAGEALDLNLRRLALGLAEVIE